MKKMRSMINDERDGKHEIIRIFLCTPILFVNNFIRTYNYQRNTL